MPHERARRRSPVQSVACGGIRVDLGRRNARFGDTEEVVEQQQILRVGGAKPSAHLYAGGCAVHLTNPGGSAQQVRNDVQGDLAGQGLTEGPEYVDTARSRDRCSLAHHTALADTRGPDHTDDSAVSTYWRSSSSVRTVISCWRPTSVASE